ncbi:hypothetical protein J6590_025700 [Homalodisca vitripennis]|nr:hypothetical protein J6590_025700 [Homalodisca vitripennis]
MKCSIGTNVDSQHELGMCEKIMKRLRVRPDLQKTSRRGLREEVQGVARINKYVISCSGPDTVPVSAESTRQGVKRGGEGVSSTCTLQTRLNMCFVCVRLT